MPNHYSNVIICGTKPSWHEDTDAHEWLKKTVKDGGLCNSAIPRSAEAKESADRREPGYPPMWHTEAINNWGTKWGDYDGAIDDVPGDCGDMIIKFSSAWEPPHDRCRAAIRTLLAEKGVLARVWVGCDPYDNSTSILEDWTTGEP